MTKAILYYTDSVSLKGYIAVAVRNQLLKANLPIIAVSQLPIDFGDSVCIGPIGRSRVSMTKQVLLGLDNTNADVVFIVEHDVLYHPSYFEFSPTDKDTLYFNQNMWRVRSTDGANFKEKHNGAVSQLVGLKWTLREWFMERLDCFDLGKSLIALQGYDWYKRKPAFVSPRFKFEGWDSPVPTVDIRHGGNLTRGRRFIMEESREIPGWGDPRGRFIDFLKN